MPEREIDATLLPVLSSSFDEASRLDFVRNDLISIAERGAEQVKVHEYATTVSAEIIRTASMLNLPNTRAVAELMADEEDDEPSEQLTLNALARRMASIKPDEVRLEGVSGTDMVRDLLKALHPDVQDQFSLPLQAEETFKAVTEAQQYKDDIASQGLYASTVSEIALKTEGASLPQLERARYKAWLALEAGKGRFSSIEEVNAWRERELAIVPYKVRTNLMISTFNIFADLIGAKGNSITLHESCYFAVSEGHRASLNAAKKVRDQDTSVEEIAKARLVAFDQTLSDIVQTLIELKASTGPFGHSWTEHRLYLARKFGNKLKEAAEALEGKVDFRKIMALGGVALELMMTPPVKPSVLPKHDKDDYYEKSNSRNIINTQKSIYNKDKYSY